MSSLIQLFEEKQIFRQKHGYNGCVAGLNGCIYGMPYYASRIVEFNPATNTTRHVGDDFGDNKQKWFSGVLGPDGCIYGCPHNTKQILKYNPATETTTLVGDPILTWQNCQYTSGVAVPETGMIYFIPSMAKQILEYNITNGNSSMVGDVFSGRNFKWDGACLSTVDGCIYCVPGDYKHVLKFNPRDKTTSSLSGTYSNSQWFGCVEGPDGSIYGAPLNATHFLKINVQAGTTSLVGRMIPAQYGWSGCASFQVNNHWFIIMIPHDKDRLVLFSMRYETCCEIGPSILHGQGEKYMQPAISSFDGCIYSIPSGENTSILKIDLTIFESIYRSIEVRLPWLIMKEVAEANVNALTEEDASTGMLPFMTAAERCSEDDEDEEGNENIVLDSLTTVYELLRMKPEVLKHYTYMESQQSQ